MEFFPHKKVEKIISIIVANMSSFAIQSEFTLIDCWLFIKRAASWGEISAMS